MLRDYDELIELLGHESASDRAAIAMWKAINERVVARKNA